MTNYYCYNLSSLQIIFLPQFDEFSWFEYKCFPHTYIQTIALFASWGKLFSLSFLYFSLKLTERFFFFFAYKLTERLRLTKGYVLITLSLQKKKKGFGICETLLVHGRKRRAKRFIHKFTISTFPSPQPVTDNEPWFTNSQIFSVFLFSFLFYSRISARTIADHNPGFLIWSAKQHEHKLSSQCIRKKPRLIRQSPWKKPKWVWNF